MNTHFLSRITLLCSLSFVLLSLSAQDYALRFYDDSNGLSHWRTTRTLQDTTGMMWIATYNGLNRFDGYQFVAFKAQDDDGLSLSSDRIRRIELQEDNNILCLIDDSVLLFNTHSCRFETLPFQAEQAALNKMQMRRNPDLWREKEIYSTLGNLRMKNIRRDYEDRQGNHWLIDDHGFYIATPIPARGTRINKDEVRAMQRLQNGQVWVSIRGTKQLAVYDSALHLMGYMAPNGRVQKQAVPFTSQVYCIHESRDGRIWMGCKPGGLMERQRNKPQATKEYHEVRNVYDIAEDRNGAIWAASFGFGLWREVPRDDTQSTKQFVQIPGTEDMRIRKLLVTEDNTLLAATSSGLLVVNGNTGEIEALHRREGGRPQSLSSNALMCLTLFNGELYIGTEGGGVNRLIGNDYHAPVLNFEHLNEGNGLNSDIIHDFMPWSGTELLIQCNNALSILNTADNTIVNYGKSFFHTAQNAQFNMGEVGPVDLHNGHVLIAPHDGILMLDKETLHPETKQIPVALSAIALEGKANYAVNHLTHLTMAPNERSIAIRFAALDYRGNEDIRYQTRFCPASKTHAPWNAPTEQSTILMQDLQPGDYIFEVRSTNALGQWQNNIRRLHITVTPTFRESTWGRALPVIFLLLVTITITHLIVRNRATRREREETLAAYLELQEGISAKEKEKSTQTLPVPEILAPGRLSKDEEFINTLHQFLEENMDNSEMVIDDLANRVCMSRSSLNRKMHDLFNLSAKDFIQAARIKHACQLLQTTDMSTKEVAFACGFSDPKYFAKSFKSETGKTPTEYRQA